MKTHTLVAASALLLGTFPSFGTVIVNYNFNSLSTGDLVGQDGWTQGATSGPGISPTVALSPNTTNYVGSNAASSSSSSSGVGVSYNIEFTAGTVTTSSLVRLEFDVYRPSGSPVAFLGIGDSSTSVTSAYFGISGNQFQLRAHNFGTNNVVSGANFNSSQWYRVASEWNLTTGMATMYAKNLTDPLATAWQTNTTDAGGGWRQLYFGAGFTNASVALDIPGSGTGSVANWDSAFIRMNPSGATSYADNLNVQLIPEPGTSLLAGMGAASLLFFRRRRS
ncbi:MAG: PEP-CTERM sorting domain-containing protein [Chthoniobacterales bacterium]|nr:PEP-CTERM sorting domain-containing protein [Chthoniobacterales bacterium]